MTNVFKQKFFIPVLAVSCSVFLLLLVASSSAMPVLAQNSGASQAEYDGSYCATAVTSFLTLADMFKFVTCGLQRLVLPLLFTFAGLVFVWGTVKFIAAKDSAEKEEGQQFMLWGVIAFAVMLSIWGIIRIFTVTFHLGNTLPVVPVTTKIQ